MQRSRNLCLLTLLCLAACTDKSSPAADGGTSGQSGGGTGGGGSGGKPAPADGGVKPGGECTPDVPFVAMLLDESGDPVEASLTAHVTVVSSEACDEHCPESLPKSWTYPLPSDARRIVLEDPSQTGADGGADGVRWTLVMRLEGLPNDLLALNESYDLTLTAARGHYLAGSPLSQTIVFARDGALVLALAEKADFPPPLKLPDLSAFGLTLTRDAPVCVVPDAGQFGRVQTKLRISAGDDSVVVDRGGSARLGELMLQLSKYDGDLEPRGSDSPERLQLGIYRVGR